MKTDDPEAQKRILHRLRRARGQLDAVIAAVEQDKPSRARSTVRDSRSSRRL
jgi:DNA-binding FrmR family transcriptional regulator